MWMVHIDCKAIRPVMEAVHVCVVQATMDPVHKVQLPKSTSQVVYLKWVRGSEPAC